MGEDNTYQQRIEAGATRNRCVTFRKVRTITTETERLATVAAKQHGTQSVVFLAATHPPTTRPANLFIAALQYYHISSQLLLS